MLKTLEQIKLDFPNAVVQIDTFESFVDALLARSDIVDSLTVFTEEMGDIWYVFSCDSLHCEKRLNQKGLWHSI